MLSSVDLSVIAMVWLALSNLGFVVTDLDLTEPGFKQQHGPHIVYTFSILLRDETEFPENAFSDLLDQYSRISPVKPHCYSIQHYPASQCFYMDASETKRKTGILKNYSRIYVSVFL